ncbi:MAG TPA: hypothetical protein D7H91_04445 [Candidatus Poseidoniales archaeon]|jgi:hypothetical protein|nr:MAG TPA: hypothetical protein D7H91_04445 [Candidatus Poseidoniales archaeon]HII78270.1 hypothetical protein [Poseidonia sp.]|tara:strand:+ start:217 stop:1188 length:972 start_codon:yes stop_codon:yes gene_type:complete
MKRIFTLFVVASLLLVPTMGSANPNGVGEGTFDAQCGGACHGDADMNRSSASTVTVSGPSTAYEGLPTSVDVTVSNIETTVSGLLGIFLLSDLSGAGDTPADDGWTIVSNSEGGTQNYVEVLVEPGQTEHTVSWTLRAPTTGSYGLHAAIHHGTQDGSEAPFFGSTIEPIEINVVPVPEDLPRLSPSFEPPVVRTVGEMTNVQLSTQAVDAVQVEWRVSGGPVQTATVVQLDQETWTFELPASLQPVTVEWRAHLQGEGPEQSTPWFALQSEDPSWSVDETAAYVQSLAMLLLFMVAFMSLQRRNEDPIETTKDDAFDQEVQL